MVCALLSWIPTLQEYMDIVAHKIHPFADDLYRYLKFDQIAAFEDERHVILLEEMPRIENSLGMSAAASR